MDMQKLQTALGHNHYKGSPVILAPLGPSQAWVILNWKMKVKPLFDSKFVVNRTCQPLIK